MKNLLKLSIIALLAISMNACKNTDTADKVAEKYLNAINKKEYSEARALATAESKEMIDMYENMSKMGGESAKESVIAGIKCTESGDTAAVCDFTKDGEAQTLKMVKKDGKWLVNEKKETPPMNMDSMMDDTDSTTTTESSEEPN